jgi:hypothetical protein
VSPLQNIAIGIAVVVIAMGCMVFGDWLQTSRLRQPNYDYCSYARSPDDREVAATQDDAATKQNETRKAANERYHELCNQWRSAEYAQDAARVAWIQLWVGLAGLGGLIATVIFAATSAKAAGDAAKEMARSVDVQMRSDGPLPFIEEILTTDNAPSTVTAMIKNLGKSPVVLIEWTIDCQTGADSLPQTRLAYGEPQTLKSIVLGSEGGPRKLWWFFFDDEKLGPAFDEAEPAVLWGYIRYEDIYSRRRIRGFGFRTAHNQLMGTLLDEKGRLYWDHAGGETYNYDREEFTSG